MADKLIKSTGNLVFENSSGQQLLGAGGSGSGEKNYVSNPSASIDTTGWAESTSGQVDLTRTDTAAELPREFTTETGLKVLNTVAGTTDYVYYRFSLDDVDANKKLKITFDQKVIGAFVADSMEVVMHSNTQVGYDGVDTAITIVNPEIKGVDGSAVYTFDTNGDTYYELRLRSTATSVIATGITVSDLVVGPGTVVTSAVVTATQDVSTDITLNNFAESYVDMRMQRVGDRAKFSGAFLCGSTVGSTGSLDLPSGLTLDNTKIGTVTDAQVIGHWTRADTTGPSNVFATGARAGVIIYDSASETRMYFAIAGQSGAYNLINGSSFASGDRINLDFEIPIAEWAGGSQDTITVGFGEATTDQLGLVKFGGTSKRLDSGTYTPTGTAIINVGLDSDVDTYETAYTVIGKVVTLSGRVDIDPTSTGVTEFAITTPAGYDVDTTVAFPVGGTGMNAGGIGIMFSFGAAVTLVKGALFVSSLSNSQYRFNIQYITTG